MEKLLSCFVFFSVLSFPILSGQGHAILLENPSFEGTPGEGKINGPMPEGWFDCGFPGETVPDVHPTPYGAFGVIKQPYKGKTYLGMVVRDLNTWEAVGQHLSAPLEAGKCYDFSIHLCRSETYFSPSRLTGQLVNFNNPVSLKIWGGADPCAKQELLAVSQPVENADWQPYFFTLNPYSTHDFLILEAAYENPVNPENGNILLDFISINSEGQPCEPPYRFEFSRPLMGTEFRILLYTRDSLLARQAAEKAFLRVDALEKIFSDYREDSEVTAICAGAGSKKWQKVSPELCYLTQYSKDLSKLTDGAFDVSTGALTKLWRKAFRQKQLPDIRELKVAKSTSGYEKIDLDVKKNKIRLLKSGLQLDFGGIAKGYAVDQALFELRKAGINSALVDGGGDIAAGNAPPGKDGWEIEYLAPGEDGPITKKISICGVAVATSGDTYRYLEWDGKRYSHIIDPRTGIGLTNRRIVTVFAPTCTMADAWATAISVGIPEQTRNKLEKQGIWINLVED